MKRLSAILLLLPFCLAQLPAEDLTGTICDESNSPIAEDSFSAR